MRKISRQEKEKAEQGAALIGAILADLRELGLVYDIALATTLSWRAGRDGFTSGKVRIAEEALMRRVARLVRLSRIAPGAPIPEYLPAVEPVAAAEAGLVVPGA